jgi:PAS domain S-box-containing protein
MHLQIIPYYDPEGLYTETYSISRVYFIFFLNFLAFAITSMLGIYLSEKTEKSYKQLREQEEKLAQLKNLYQNVVESMASGLITLDINGNLTFANTSAYKILREKNKSELPALHFDNVFSEIITFESLKEKVREKVFYRVDGAIVRNGEKIEIGAVASTLCDINNNIMGYLIVFQDITDVKNLQERLRIKDRMAALGEMAAGMAHEIRNPLSAIKGAIQLLNSNNRQDSIEELTNILIKETNRLNRLIEAFINYAKPPPINLRKCNLNEIVKGTLERLVNYGVINNNIKLEFRSSCHECFVLMDVEQFEQAIQNIVKNAVQAMPNGGSLIIEIQEEDSHWMVEFKDTGKGIEPHRLRNIFDPFQHSTTGGAGLGMAIIYRIIKEHNGIVEVKSELNKGTSVIVKIPKIQLNTNENI